MSKFRLIDYYIPNDTRNGEHITMEKTTKPTHIAASKLSRHVKFTTSENIQQVLHAEGYIESSGTITKKAEFEGLAIPYEDRRVWVRTAITKKLLELTKDQKTTIVQSNKKPASKEAINIRSKPQTTDQIKWVDLDTIGTYFGVSKIKVGKWLDEIGLRKMPEIPTDSDGSTDMLDMANQSKKKQNGGFISKEPTEKALERGFAQQNTFKVKDKTVTGYKWNLEMVKKAFIKKGHELDHDKTMTLKGKGKNSNVSVDSVEGRAKKLYQEWKQLHNNPSTRNQSWKVFDKQPRGILIGVEKLMGRPRFLQDKQYLKK